MFYSLYVQKYILNRFNDNVDITICNYKIILFIGHILCIRLSYSIGHILYIRLSQSIGHILCIRLSQSIGHIYVLDFLNL